MLSLIAAPRLLITHTVLSTKVFLNEMLAREALVILSLLSQDYGRKLFVPACCLAPWDNAKKYISASDLEPDQDKGSQETVTGDTGGDSLNGHIWPCFVKYEAHCDPLHRVWVSHCYASNFKGCPF